MPDDRIRLYPSRRRRQSQQHEAREQIRLMTMLGNLLDPDCTFCTAIENRPRSAMAGMFQKKRGVRSGLPDIHVLYCGQSVYLEVKSPIGMLSKVQREMRLKLLAGGAKWFLVRSARAGAVALHRAGVPLWERGKDGQRRPWRPPPLLDWEQPVQDPSVRHPAHPALRLLRREAKRKHRWRERQRAWAAQQAMETPPPSGAAIIAWPARPR